MSNYAGIRAKIHAYTKEYNGLARLLPDTVKIGSESSSFHGRAFNAIWDTSASRTTISEKVVAELSLPVISMQKINTAGGTHNATVHYVSLGLPNGIGFKKVMVNASKLVEPLEVLIGMDVIACGDFTVSNFNGKTKLSFRMPSCAETDYVQWAKNNDSSVKKEIKTDRNDPCPCGTGKKYKNCCIHK